VSATTERLVDVRGTNAKIADAIRWVIQREDLQQNWVGVASGLSPDELSRRMTGKVPFDLDDVADIARALNMDMFGLLHLADDVADDLA